MPSGAFVARRNGRIFVTGNSGFPKSHDISKAIDKAAGRIGESVLEIKREIRRRYEKRGMTLHEFNAACGFEASGYLRESSTWAGVLPSRDKWERIKSVIGCNEELDALFAEAEREVVGQITKGSSPLPGNHNGTWSDGQIDGTFAITAPATDAAKQWDGWGTALKPAWEPVILARKPLSEPNIAANVLRWGTGGLNVDGCRIEGKPRTTHTDGNHKGQSDEHMQWRYKTGYTTEGAQGRWPANLALDEDAAELLDAQSGERKSGAWNGHRNTPKTRDIYGTFESADEVGKPASTGGASRFFYCAKASKRDRDEGLEGMPEQAGALRENGRFHSGGRTQVDGEWVETGSEPLPKHNGHPTVKPTDLMRWLVRLVTPPNGTVLDPFMGSGSTGKAAMLEGFSFVGIDIEQEYLDIAEKRIVHAIAQYVKQQELAALQPRLIGDTP